MPFFKTFGTYKNCLNNGKELREGTGVSFISSFSILSALIMPLLLLNNAFSEGKRKCPSSDPTSRYIVLETIVINILNLKELASFPTF